MKVTLTFLACALATVGLAGASIIARNDPGLVAARSDNLFARTLDDVLKREVEPPCACCDNRDCNCCHP